MLICGVWVRMAKQLTCALNVSRVMNTSGCCRDAPEFMQCEANAELLLHQELYALVRLTATQAVRSWNTKKLNFK
jgi:hypothetical protein